LPLKKKPEKESHKPSPLDLKNSKHATLIAELFSSPNMTDALKAAIQDIPTLELLPGFWERVGHKKAQLLRAGKKARLADTMIATCSLDHNTPINARDSDYRHFNQHCGLIVHSGIPDS
jgi:predicted nucleic acid-binding protein